MSYHARVMSLPVFFDGISARRDSAAEIAAEADAALVERDALIEKLAGALSDARRVWEYYRCDADREVVNALSAVEAAIEDHAQHQQHKEAK